MNYFQACSAAQNQHHDHIASVTTTNGASQVSMRSDAISRDLVDPDKLLPLVSQYLY